MFKIADGREHLYAWDLDRQIVVEDPSIVEVHFCNRTDECSLVVEVKDEDGLRVANVPNILLQNSFDIRVFGYDGKATRFDKVFKVKPRTKPSDYMYTETVIKSVSEILEAAELVSTTANEFYEFAEDYKLTLVDDGEGNVELKAVGKEEGGDADLSNYFTKDETDARIAEAVGNIEIPEVDLTGYAKTEDIPDISGKADKEHEHSQYLTEHQSLEEYAKLTDIPDISGKADKEHEHPQYLTEHQSLEGYAKLTDIPTDYLTSIPAEYVTEDELSGKGYATEQYVDDAIANIDIPESGGGGASGVKAVTLVGSSTEEIVNCEGAGEELAYLYTYYMEHETFPSDRVYYIKAYPEEADDRAYLVTSMYCYEGGYCYLCLYTAFDSDLQENRSIECALKKNSDGSCSSTFVNYMLVHKSLSLDLPVWNYTTYLSDSNLYSAAEVYVALNYEGTDGETYRAFSHLVCNARSDDKYCLGDFAGEKIYFTAYNSDAGQTPYWVYDGSSIDYFNAIGSLEYVAYKF